MTGRFSLPEDTSPPGAPGMPASSFLAGTFDVIMLPLPMTDELNNAPFFILGCPRSGTSLLSRMLDRHPRLSVPYESHLFNTFYPLLERYGSLAQDGSRRRLVRDILSTDVMHDWDPRLSEEEVLSCIRGDGFGDVVGGVMGAWAARQKKPRWGEKTPHHLGYWREIHTAFPLARFVHIVRDARDVSLSLVAARFGPKTCYGAARHWVRYVESAAEAGRELGEKSFTELKYEDLLSDPEGTLTRLSAFLGEEYSPSMLEFYKGGGSYMTDERNLENLKRPLLLDNVARWEKEMSPGDLRVVEAVAGGHLRRFGYALSLEDPQISAMERLYFEVAAGPARKALAMAKNRKGQRDAWIRFGIRARLLLRRPSG